MAITPVDKVREKENDTMIERGGGGGLKSNSLGHLESTTGENTFLLKSLSYCTAGNHRPMSAEKEVNMITTILLL